MDKTADMGMGIPLIKRRHEDVVEATIIVVLEASIEDVNFSNDEDPIETRQKEPIWTRIFCK
jgi:hypothetical protein